MATNSDLNRNRKAIRIAIKKLSGVRLTAKTTPLSNIEWKELNDLYKILGDIRSNQLDWEGYENLVSSKQA